MSALKASLKPLAVVKRDDKWQQIDAAVLVPGDMVLLAAGAAVPADCVVSAAWHDRREGCPLVSGIGSRCCGS